MEELRVETGTLLAAWPDLRDPNFMHSVVLICEHTENGAYGLVLNRRTEYKVGQLLPDHPLLGQSELPVHFGGPVDHTSLQFLHRIPGQVPGGHPIAGELHIGGNLQALGRYLLENPDSAASTVRMFVGYSGWGAGQLEGELGIGSWLPAAFDVGVIFEETDSSSAWRRVVRSVGGESRGLENLPPDASWN